MPSSSYKVVIVEIMLVNWSSECDVFVMQYVCNVSFEEPCFTFVISDFEKQWWGYSVDYDNNGQKQRYSN